MKLRKRFWIESIFALFSIISLLFTITQKDWVEIIFDIDPDQFNGSFEWLITITLIICTLILAASALYEIRRVIHVSK